MKRLGALTCVAATLLAVLAIPGQTSAQPNQFTIFDPPGSTNTLPRSINPMGVIIGQYTDASNVVHGFLRAPDGNITTIDPPGSIYTDPTSINLAGAIAGFFTDASHVGHGFLRDLDGTFTLVDPPSSTHIIHGLSINPAGVIAGLYQDYDDIEGLPRVHGFVRERDGTFTTFDFPGWSFLLSTPYALGINPAGAITGAYEAFTDPGTGIAHGFVRAPDGAITTLDPPGSPFTIPWSINPAGAITGQYVDGSAVMMHGFLRAPDGTITTLDPPGSIYTVAQAINPGGTIVGGYAEAGYTAWHVSCALPMAPSPHLTLRGRLTMSRSPSAQGVKLRVPMKAQMGSFMATCGGSDSDASASLGTTGIAGCCAAGNRSE